MTAVLTLLPQFRKFISVCKKGKRTKYIGKKLAKGTIAQYECVYKLLEEFEKKESSSITIQLLKKTSIAVTRKEKKYWDKFLQNFLSFLYKDKKYFDNYVASVLKVVKTFFNYLYEEKGLPVSKFYRAFKIETKEFTPVILSPSQLKFLISDKHFENSLPPHLKRTKDIFVFGCTPPTALFHSTQMLHTVFVRGTPLQQAAAKTLPIFLVSIPTTNGNPFGPPAFHGSFLPNRFTTSLGCPF